eukprot:Protomagalhaensia_wolfi_Nauph_80__558@NODE_1316_length_1591_cov_541_290593_g1017_i0_p1_GENE_NODE_1316_length_1591_cov_541_290593_g1017_i0NODE_1316_length_1591_cov_541_290593_g1017_i0_p1_ORF_typecomplete_len198_score41_71Chromo/PF00385_24/4_4e10Chromo/PF00385_24/4_1e02FAP/PF07174_11/0_005Chromo_shadow/PF01393_19/6_5Chromo_shadow/PF01393_19/14MAP65_ASE1/PF03999_12/0_081Totivirus_coat/PF05518_11/2_NODE_1316_length_1591_cov_541_290593_g1017_i09161509
MTAQKASVTDDDVYEMEDIVGFRVVDGQEQWLVKWKDYEDEADRTWEPKSNFLNPGAMLVSKMEQYRKEYMDKKPGSRKRGASTTTSKEAKPERTRKARKTTDEEQVAPQAPAPEKKHQSPPKLAPPAPPPVEKPQSPEGDVVVSHLGKGHGGTEYQVTLKWSNGYEESMGVNKVRSLYSAQLLDYLLSRVRFRDEH